MIQTTTEYATEQQRAFDAATTEDERRSRGHFGTPAEIADFMATMFRDIPARTIRILDAGAGVGVLTAAVCRRLCEEGFQGNVIAELWENDPKLQPYLLATLQRCAEVSRSSRSKLEFTIRTENFILANSQKTLFSEGPSPTFDFAILNPPYYKLRKDAAESRAMEHVVHGQPNIYALFMAAAAGLLVPRGQMVAITPRSYFNGPYFRKFRKCFFDRMTVRQIHAFESRTEAFREGGVLQENVILLAEKDGKPAEVALTTSVGRLFPDAGKLALPYARVVDDTNGDHIIRVAATDVESAVVAAIDSLPARIRDLGYEISTGPVVSFRATELLREWQTDDTAPLLWLHNVRPFITRFPSTSNKPGHIEVSGASRRLLVPAKRYVILKRFTAKEERKRIVAGIVERTDSYADWLGLENHLNYIYRRAGEMTRVEALGLAAYLNSSVVDRYFRAVSGNTQVNASEIRALPFPDSDTLLEIGRHVPDSLPIDELAVERTVNKALRLPASLTEQLCESAT